MDVLTISTGLGVASNYVYTVPYTLVLGVILLLIVMMIGIRMTRVRFTRKGSIACRVLAFSFILAVAVPFYTTDFAANHGILESDERIPQLRYRAQFLPEYEISDHRNSGGL